MSYTIIDNSQKNQNEIRFEALSRVLVNNFGLDISRYTRSLIDLLLGKIPADTDLEDKSSLQKIVATCSIGETTFMRHPEQFNALKTIVPSLPGSRKGRPLKVWSAGCASGEEAYSLAATLKSYSNGVRVLGTDINPESIDRAKRARYRFWSLRGLDVDQVQSWLHIGPLEIEVCTQIRSLVDFDLLNLAQDSYPSGFDLIFCRNVLLYFCKDLVQKIFERLSDSLAPGGVLFIGYVDPVPEKLFQLSSAYIDKVQFFRKSKAVEPPTPVKSHGKSEPLPQPKPEELEELNVDNSFNERLNLARGLAERGMLKEAAELLRNLSFEHPLEVVPNVLLSIVLEEAGQIHSALEAARRACFLAPGEPITSYLLGSCLMEVGEKRLAINHFRQVLSALNSIKDLSKPLKFGEGISGAQLRRMLDVQFSNR
jgi:chemotaxis protein methyltransferase CheR